MADIWIDNKNGDNGNGGTSPSDAFETITYALTQASDYDVLKILPGLGQYQEGEFFVNEHAQWLKVVGVGKVVINSIGFDWVWRHSRTFGGEHADIENLIMTGWELYFYKPDHSTQGQVKFSSCTIYQKDAKYDTTWWSLNSSEVWAKNTSIFGVDPRLYISGALVFRQCKNIIWFTAAPNGWGSFGPTNDNSDYNAVSSNSVPRGTNGWDPAAYPPPFYSADTTSPDLRWDTTATYYDKYHHEDGEGGRMVGHPGPVLNHYSDSYFDGHYLNDNDTWGAFENDERWYDTTTGAPGVEGPADAGPALISVDNIKVDQATEPEAFNCRAFGQVWDLGEPITVTRVQITKAVEESGEIDTNETAPRQIEIRADASSFNATDAAGTTDLDWTLVTYNDGTVYVGETYRHWQIRITVVLDAV